MIKPVKVTLTIALPTTTTVARALDAMPALVAAVEKVTENPSGGKCRVEKIGVAR